MWDLQPGVELTLPVVEAQNLNHWTAREALHFFFFFFLLLLTGVWSSQSCDHEQPLVPLYISDHLFKLYKCSYLQRWINLSRADDMGTSMHPHRYSTHLCPVVG